MQQKSQPDKPVLLVVLPAGVIGGAETRALNLLKNLKTFHPVLLTQASIANYYLGAGFQVELFDEYGCAEPYSISFLNIIRYSRTIAVTAKRCNAGVVLAFMHNGTLFSSAGKSLGFHGLPVVGTVLGSISAYFKAEGRVPSWWERLIIRQCTKGPVSGLIVPSSGVRSDLIQNHGAVPDRVINIYNGVDLDRCRNMAKVGPSPYRSDLATIVSVCRFSPQKDFRTLLLAFKRVLEFRPARLVLVGDGGLFGGINKMARDLGISDAVEMPGFLVNPYPYIAHADVFVLSSFYEGFGNVIVESMALGVPVVSTDCDFGPGEIITDGRDGYLVPVSGWRLMADRILELLEGTAQRKKISDEGLRRAERFGIDAMVSAFESYIKTCLR